MKHKTPRSEESGHYYWKKLEGNICECYTNNGFIPALFFEIKAICQSQIIFESESNMGDLSQRIENTKHWGFKLQRRIHLMNLLFQKTSSYFSRKQVYFRMFN